MPKDRVMDLAEKLASAVERQHGGCQPWPATQRRMVAHTLRAILVDEMVGTEWEETVKRLEILEAKQ